MVSNTAMIGMLVIFVVSITVPIIGLIVCVKATKRGNILFTAILGLVAMAAANNLSNVVGSVKPMYELAVSGKVWNFVLYLLSYAAAFGLLTTIIRWLTLNYAEKSTGGKVGFYRTLAAGIGLGGGLVMPNAMNYVGMLAQARMINAGTLLDVITQGENGMTVEEAEAYIARIVSQSSAIYYLQAVDRVLIILVEVTLTLMLMRFFKEERRAFGMLFTGAVRMIFEFFRMVISYLSDDYMGNLVSDNVCLVIDAVYMVIVAFFCVMTCYVIRSRKLIEDEKPAGPSKKEQQKQAQDIKAWSEMRNLSQKNLSKVEFDDPYETKESPAEEEKKAPEEAEEPERSVE